MTGEAGGEQLGRGQGRVTVVHEAVVAQAHAERHGLLSRLAVSLAWDKRGTVALGELATLSHNPARNTAHISSSTLFL